MDPAAARYYQAQTQEKLQQLQSIHNQLQTLLTKRQKTLASESENEMVQKEFDLIRDDDTPVYKLVGPVLVKQDLEEARENVKNRLNYFKQEKNRLDNEEHELEKQRLKCNDSISAIQETVRKLQQQAVQQATEK